MKRCAAQIHGWLLLFSFSLACRSTFAAAEEIPTLRPPHDELHPSFWEQHGGWLVLAFVVVASAVLLGWKLLRRPKPEIVTPPEVLARRALEALRGRVEDMGLVVEVSQILRRYVVSAFQLPPHELTTAELQRAFQSQSQISATLTTAVIHFLSKCDERKFASVTTAALTGTVARALELVNDIEASRHPALQAVAPSPATAPNSRLNS